MQPEIFSERSLSQTSGRLLAIAALVVSANLLPKPACAQTTSDLPNAPSVARLIPDAPPTQDFSSPARSGVTPNTPAAPPCPKPPAPSATSNRGSLRLNSALAIRS
jgi:hypothetical protein